MPSNLPLVCVCIPVYNGSKTIGLTIESILSQNYPNFEILVCDNLSTDNTMEIVNGFKASESIRITTLTNPNKGTAEDNWNFMLSNLKTDAEYISLYHADDIYHSDIIQEQVGFMLQNDLKASFTLCRLINDEGADITISRKYKSELPAQINSTVFHFEDLFKHILRFRNFIITPTCMFKKEIMDSITPFFDCKKSKSSSDLDTWLRISRQYKIGILPKVLLSYRISTSQGSFIIKQGRTEPADFFKVVDAHIHELIDKRPYHSEMRYYNIMKSVDLIICSVNMLKQEDDRNAETTLKKALKLLNTHAFSRLKYIKIYSFALVALFLLKLKLDKWCYKMATISK